MIAIIKDVISIIKNIDGKRITIINKLSQEFVYNNYREYLSNDFLDNLFVISIDVNDNEIILYVI